MKTRFSEWSVSYSARGLPTYRLELWHDGLKRHREIKGRDKHIVHRKAQMQAADWDGKWRTTQQKSAETKHRDDRKTEAAERNLQAQQELAALKGVLAATLDVDDAIEWEELKDRSAFPEPEPKPYRPPAEPSAPPLPPEPRREDARFNASLGLADRILSSRRRKKTEREDAAFDNAHSEWTSHRRRSEEEHRKAREAHAREVEEGRRTASRRGDEWQKRRAEFLKAQAEANASIDAQRLQYEAREPAAIEEYCDMVLSNSEYPDWMPKEFGLEFSPENGILVVEYSLPVLDQLPTLAGVTYVQSRDEFSKKRISKAEQGRLYDALIYQISLRTIHELFEADRVGALTAVAFNGRVTSIDPSTGQEVTRCILSLHANREEFANINLAQVDPKACFKSLKGVGSSKLHSLTPIAPIMEMRREDGRFVAAREMANTLDDSVNLAAMDWEDFEHLIREIFQQEFSSTGGEVKVTQASRDGGVDAIAFDPDPIRGGKIVIQAKRYTNTVGVAAVRDLYGTVVNEGATKGVLVTTSDYGPDAYSFAKEKPLVLLNGANLLHMLEKHGRRARINIAEAKAEQGRENH